MSEEREPVGGKLFTLPFLICLVAAGIAAVILVKRYTQGIGAVSNMNDGYAWGIWVTYDIVVGTAFACGGFAVALLVYILNRGQYHPLVRPALLASLLGYTLAGVSILIDVGRYWQGYNILLPKYMNFNSVMLEVALCVSAYIGVLWIEFSPTFMEGWGAKSAARKVNKFMFVFIALGVLLPTMHQSSLGSLMIISGHKLSPLWQTNLLPLLLPGPSNVLRRHPFLRNCRGLWRGSWRSF
jgi:Ni/Fe-hydrogenase subunit HybB-like protein